MWQLLLRSNSLELARTRAHSLASPLDRIRSNSLTFSRTRSPGATEPFSFHCLSSCYSSNISICYVATKFCENILIGVGDMTAKRNLKECPLVVEFSFRFQFYACQSFGIFVCVTVQNFGEIGLSATELAS